MPDLGYSLGGAMLRPQDLDYWRRLIARSSFAGAPPGYLPPPNLPGVQQQQNVGGGYGASVAPTAALLPPAERPQQVPMMSEPARSPWAMNTTQLRAEIPIGDALATATVVPIPQMPEQSEWNVGLNWRF